MRWSPDGRRIAFDAVSTGDPAFTDAYVFVMNADGEELHRLVRGHDLAWSPDATKIAYAAASLSASGIGVVTPRGVQVRSLRCDLSPEREATKWKPAVFGMSFESALLRYAKMPMDFRI